MDTTTVALIASGIGASGAIAAQVIAAIFTALRERKKLKWERQRQFLDTRRDVYVRYLALATRQDLYLRDFHAKPTDEQMAEFNEHCIRFVKDGSELVAEMSLFNPEIALLAGNVVNALAGLEIYLRNGPPDEYMSLKGVTQDTLKDLEHGMRSDLGIVVRPGLVRSTLLRKGAS
jgi:hypothetical protein